MTQKSAIPVAKFGFVDLTLQDQDLLAQGQVFQEQVVAGAQEVPKEVEDGGQHAVGIVRDSVRMRLN